MLDGRHTGTGGGNHIVLGGATPADSPFLRRPDLLRSLRRLLAQPSVAVVSVLGSVHRSDQPGAARGRSAPRQRLRAGDRLRPAAGTPGTDAPPWLVDRLFRHLLVDVTGNTHRAEFCIDKLYSPDRASGRARAARAARVRDAAARADEPGAAAAAAGARRAVLAGAVHARRSRAGAPSCTIASCCRTSSQLDFDDVARARCAQRAIRFDPAWFAPHFEFRFPLAGEMAARGDPADAAPGARALARARRRGRGRRHGALRGLVGRAAAGARHRAHARALRSWPATAARCRCSRRGGTASTSPACATARGSRRRALHPTIPVHAPLTFDIVDTWMERSLGGCQYHVMHPGGRNYEQLPGQQLRGREPPPGALLRDRPHARPSGRGAGRAQPGVPVHAGPAHLTNR